MNVSDKIIKYLEKKGVKHCHMITGGHVMYLNDAIFKSKIKPVFYHHEQAAAMAAEAYGRIAGIGVVMVTAGPGCVNALNGIVGAFADSTPLMIISGANNSPEILYMRKHKMRQVGLQGYDVEPTAKSITKYFKTVLPTDNINEILEEAYKQATTDRKGAVWLEIPLDTQSHS